MDADWPETDFPNDVIAEHKAWCKTQKRKRCHAKFKHLLRNNKNAAIHEAIVRRYFQQARFKVEANELDDDSAQAPDFRCTKGDSTFYVECMFVETDSVADKSGIPQDHTGFTPFRLITKRLAQVSENKLEQCSNLSAPVLVAAGVFHSHSFVLLKRVTIEQLLWPRLASEKPSEDDEFFEAPFFTKTGSVKCQEISGILFVRSSCENPIMHGILHPQPKHPFDPSLLPMVNFGTIGEDGTNPRWTINEAEAEAKADAEVDEELYRSLMERHDLTDDDIEEDEV